MEGGTNAERHGEGEWGVGQGTGFPGDSTWGRLMFLNDVGKALVHEVAPLVP
jgi:hypothetical protein